MNEFEPGERFYDPIRWEDIEPQGPHIWRTLGYKQTAWDPGRQVIEWEADELYCFPTNSGPIVHGGMIATILDTAMGGACWTLLDNNEVFLTADLRVDFFRPARPGRLRAEGRVVRRTRRVVFCTADLFNADDALLANARCTQVVLGAEASSGRPRKTG